MNHAEIKRRQTEAFSAILTLITVIAAARITGENGVAYLVAALEIFGMLWVLIGGNASDTIGRLLWVRNSKGQYKNSVKMRRSVFLFQSVLGLAGTLLILAFADNFSEKLFRMQYSTFILSVLAPAFFLRAVSSVLLGFFQGEGTELPTAVAAILRQVFILGFGLIFGKMLGNYGYKVSNLLLQSNFTSMYGGVGFAIAIDLTELFIVIFLLLVYKGTKRPKLRLMDDGMRFTDSFFDSIRIFCMGRGGQMAIQFLVFLPFLLGFLFFQKSAENIEAAALEYGAYLAGYVSVCGIVTALVYMMILPVTGRVFLHLRKEEQRYARTVFQSGTHICMIHGIFFAAILTVLSSQAAAVISPAQAGALRKMMAGGAFVICFLILTLYFGRVLLLLGRKLFVLGALAVYDVVFAISITVFLNSKKMGALAIVYGGVIATGVLAILFGILVYRQLRCRFDFLQLLIIPAGAACVSGLLMMLLAKLLTHHLGNLITLLVTFILGEIIYWMLLIVLRNFRENETEIIPGGRLIGTVGQLFRIF